MRRVLRVFFATRRSRNKHDFHNRCREESARSGQRRLLLRRGIGALFLPLSFRDAAFFSPPSVNPCAFSQFSSVISREKSHHPPIEISKIHDRMSYTDYLSSDQITISCIECPDHNFFLSSPSTLIAAFS